MILICRLNGGPFEEGKPLLASHGSRDLEDEEVEDLVPDEEEAEEPSSSPEKREAKELTGNLSDDITQGEMDFSEQNDLKIICKTSPRR